ncbi:tetratricopeptide repeat protein [Bacillus sp. HMF5848]|uniref:tetratricopeptide repeat protein n=1 Tax=Bacillus sp. HMF5848 TaxID=2495421 RepID=UPI000F7B26F4|nr:tetratricopeptide repeat protein [Bacillus sp. HMF5848]RSK28052.1 tetratricopeptide repeat protein [Bacillus sp. HMF5848]
MKRKQKDKVVPIPGLVDRLLKQGLEAVENKKYRDAYPLLLQVKTFDETSIDAEIGIIICLIELGELKEAKVRCKELLKKGEGDYFQIFQIYATILLQLHEYNELISAVEGLLEEQNVPLVNRDNLFKMLEFSKRMRTFNDSQEEENQKIDISSSPQANVKELLHHNDLKEQWSALQTLKHRNIQPHLSVLEEFLLKGDRHPVLKSLAVHVLMEHNITKPIKVVKFDKETTIVPSAINEIESEEFTNKILECLDSEIGQDNPTLFEALKELWIRFQYVIFPFKPDPDEPEIWSAALHIVGAKMFGDTLAHKRYTSLSQEDLERACEQIEMIEKISFV